MHPNAFLADAGKTCLGSQMQSLCLSRHYSPRNLLAVRNFVMIEVMCQIGVIGIPTLPGIAETCLNVAGKKLIDCSFVETRA
jgi:hypothetical protein